MRYLWIEDFDGGKSGQTQTQHDLETYFQLENKIMKICSTLKETLVFLDIPENWRCFDAVLIDIRFKIGEKEEDEEEIYKKYFSSFLIEKKYEYYTKRVNGDANTASAGVLLYLALVHRYNYNQDRIAFISANIDETSNELYRLTQMIEYVEKAKAVGLTNAETDDFDVLNEDVFEMFQDKFGIDEKEAEKKFDIPGNIDWDNYNLDDLKERINNVWKKLKEQIQENDKENKNVDNLKYNSVRQEFEMVGLKVARAFEKPGQDRRLKESWSFQSWEDELNKEEYYRLRSAILPICLEIDKCLDEGLKKEDVLGKETTLLEMRDWIQNIMVLFPEKKWAEDDVIYSKVVKECVKFADRIEKPENSAYKAVLKITRNWTAHLEISGLTFFAVVFIFHISVNAYLNVETHEKLKMLEKNLIDEFCKSDLVENREDLLDQLEEKYKEIHKSSCEEFHNKVSNEDFKKPKKGYKFDESASFYQIISGIGHECSPKKNEVSMKMIYALFVVTLGKSIVKNGDNFINEVLVKCSE